MDRFGNDRGEMVASRTFMSSSSSPPSEYGIVKAIALRAWESPKVKVGLVLWVIGIAFMVFAPAPVTITPEMADKYDEMVYKANNLFGIQDALQDLAVAEARAYEAKTWFWRFQPAVRDKVYQLQEVVDQKQAVVNQLEAKKAEMLREANAYVGLWSEYSFSEVRERFWGAFESGKVFAKRQTFWDMFFSLLRSREEHFLSILIQWVFMALINFTLGLLGSLFYFVFSLASMVYSYQPDPLSAVAFYVLAFLGGASLVATYLAGLYGAAATGMYVVGKLALRNSIEYRQRQQEQARLTGQRRAARQGDHSD